MKVHCSSAWQSTEFMRSARVVARLGLPARALKFAATCAALSDGQSHTAAHNSVTEPREPRIERETDTTTGRNVNANRVIPHVMGKHGEAPCPSLRGFVDAPRGGLNEQNNGVIPPRPLPMNTRFFVGLSAGEIHTLVTLFPVNCHCGRRRAKGAFVTVRTEVSRGV